MKRLVLSIILLFSPALALADQGTCGIRGIEGTAAISVTKGVSVMTSDDSIVIVGVYDGGTTNLGCTTLAAHGGTDMFLARYLGFESVGGPHACVWSKGFGGLGNENVTALAIDPNDRIYAVGFVQNTPVGGTCSVGGNIISTSGNSQDIFLARYDINGNNDWTKSFGSTGIDAGYNVAVDPNGNVIMVGTFSGSVNFGGSTLTAASGGIDTVVAKYTTAGTHVWSKRFPNSASDIAYSVAFDPNADVLITGYFTGSINFGGSTLASSGAADIFIAKLLGSDGAHVWSRKIGGPNSDIGYSIAAYTDDPNFPYIGVTGFFLGNVDFGNSVTLITQAFDTDPFILALDPNGVTLWAKQGIGVRNDHGTIIKANTLGQFVVGGLYQETIFFGASSITSLGAEDQFIAIYSITNGSLVQLIPIGSIQSDQMFGLSTGQGNNDIQAVGMFRGTLRAGAYTSVGSDGTNGYLSTISGSCALNGIDSNVGSEPTPP